LAAFILYRQHYQGTVAAQHPGLANPEISKIIGEQWRQLPTEVKNDWKRLAEVWVDTDNDFRVLLTF
jgi:HMG box factor, other